MTTIEQTPNPFAHPRIDPEVPVPEAYPPSQPLYLAEQLPLELLIEWAQGPAVNPKRDCTAAAFETAMAWSMTELALHPETTAAETADYLDDAYAYTDRAARRTGVNLIHSLSTALLDAYLPAFEARAQNSAEAIDWQAIMIDLADITDELVAAPVHTSLTHADHLDHADHTPCVPSEGERSHLVAATTLMMLGIGAGHCIYPSSPREAYTRSEGTVLEHHDAYVLGDMTKLPLRVATSSRSRHARQRRGVSIHPTMKVLPLNVLGRQAFEASEAALSGIDVSSFDGNAAQFAVTATSIGTWVADYMRNELPEPGRAAYVQSLIAVTNDQLTVSTQA